MRLEVDWIDYGFILMAYIVASGIKGLTGLGFSTSCLPILALRLDLKIAIPLVIVPSIVSNIAVMVETGHFRNAVLRFWPLYASCVPGLLIGLVVLTSIHADTARVILGLVLVSYAILALSNKPFTLPEKWEKRLKVPTGFFTGIINGLTGSQVMPILPYLLSLNLTKNDFVQAINISFTLSSLIMLLGMNQLGYLSPSTFLIAAGGLVPVVTTVYFAGKSRRHLSGTLYRRLVLIFLLTMGTILSLKYLF